jgi:predicted SAM-dependent methyltransferase
MIKSKLKKIVKSFLKKIKIKITREKDPFNLLLYRKIYNEEVLKSSPFYNIGAGSFYHPYWTNIDYASDWYGGVQKNFIHHDLMAGNPLPIAEKSAKLIYTSHTIEHIKENAVKLFFSEAYRVLEDGGVFRIQTGPDAITNFRALQANDEDWFYWDNNYVKKGSYEHNFFNPATSVSLAERWLHHVAGPLAKNDISPSKIKFNEEEIHAIIKQKGFPDCLDYFCSLVEFDSNRPGNHICWWTHDKIISFLREAGFKNVYCSGFNQSVSPLMRNSVLFDHTHPQLSIYVEAIK